MRLLKITLPLACLFIVLGCQNRKFNSQASAKSTESNQSKLELDDDGFPKCDDETNSPKWTADLSNTVPTGDLQAVARCVAKDIEYSVWDEYFKEYNENHPNAKITPTPVGKNGRAKPVACVYEGRFTADDNDRKLKNKKAYVLKGEYEADFTAFKDPQIGNWPDKDNISLQRFEISAESTPYALQLLTFWMNGGSAFITPIKKDLYIGGSYRTNGTGGRDRKQDAILSKDQTRLMVAEYAINQPKNSLTQNGEKNFTLSFECKPGKPLTEKAN